MAANSAAVPEAEARASGSIAAEENRRQNATPGQGHTRGL